MIRKEFIEDNVRFGNTDQHKHEFDKFIHIENTRLKHCFIKLDELRAIIKKKIKSTINNHNKNNNITFSNEELDIIDSLIVNILKI